MGSSNKITMSCIHLLDCLTLAGFFSSMVLKLPADVQPSWTPVFLRVASQGTLPISLLKRPKFVLQKFRVAVLLSPLLVCPRIENSVISWSLTAKSCTAPRGRKPRDLDMFNKAYTDLQQLTLQHLTFCLLQQWHELYMPAEDPSE